MEQHTIIRLTDRPEYKESMAQWFHEKWGIPKQAYLDSMDACLKGESAVPQWYAVVEDGRIIGGLGVIENDFHDRKDLSPNVCAVYVEEDRRCRGIAGALLGLACRFLMEFGEVSNTEDFTLPNVALHLSVVVALTTLGSLSPVVDNQRPPLRNG